MSTLLRFLSRSRFASALSTLTLALSAVSAVALGASVGTGISPAKSDFTVSGSLKFGTQTARMDHLYFRRQKTDDGTSVVVLVFSDHALPAFALADRQRLAALSHRKTFIGLYAEVDDSGTMKATELFEEEGSFSWAWSFEPNPVNKSNQAGKFSSDGEHDYFDKMYNVELAYALPATVNEQWSGSEFDAPKPTGLATGRADGWMEHGGQKSSLMYSVAVSETDLFGESAQRKIILSASPVTEVMLESAQGPEHALNAAGIAFLRVGLDAKANIESIMVPAPDGNPATFSSNQWDLQLTPSAPGEFDGVVQTTLGKDDNPDYPHFNLRFHATTAKPGSASPVSAEYGRALPADGGAPGRAYRDYLVALNDAKTIEELLPRRTGQTEAIVKALPENQHAAVLGFMKLEVQAGYKTVGGFTTDDRATLWVEGAMGKDKLEGRVNLLREGRTWLIGLESFRNPPAR